MTDLKETLIGIARAIVDNPDEVTVLETVDKKEVNLILSVAPDDMGMVIGKNGKIAKAIRTVMKAAASTDNRRVNVEIR
ncbi:MAG: KH domain-containing protein [Clostridia bacterium]|nr:KH domain-containing protein [Clostridia bacterium]